MYTNPSFVRANPHHVRGRKPTGSGAAWSLTLKRGPRWPQIVRLDLRAFSAVQLSHYCGDRRGYPLQSQYRRACGCAFLDNHYRPVLASHRLAILSSRRQDRGWLCNRCCTRGWFCVAHRMSLGATKAMTAREPRMERWKVYGTKGGERSRPA